MLRCCSLISSSAVLLVLVACGPDLGLGGNPIFRALENGEAPDENLLGDGVKGLRVVACGGGGGEQPAQRKKNT